MLEKTILSTTRRSNYPYTHLLEYTKYNPSTENSPLRKNLLDPSINMNKKLKIFEQIVDTFSSLRKEPKDSNKQQIVKQTSIMTQRVQKNRKILRNYLNKNLEEQQTANAVMNKLNRMLEGVKDWDDEKHMKFLERKANNQKKQIQIRLLGKARKNQQFATRYQEQQHYLNHNQSKSKPKSRIRKQTQCKKAYSSIDIKPVELPDQNSPINIELMKKVDHLESEAKKQYGIKFKKNIHRKANKNLTHGKINTFYIKHKGALSQQIQIGGLYEDNHQRKFKQLTPQIQSSHIPMSFLQKLLINKNQMIKNFLSAQSTPKIKKYIIM